MFCIKMNMFIWSFCVRVWRSTRSTSLFVLESPAANRSRQYYDLRALHSRTFLIIHKWRKGQNHTKFNLLFCSHCGCVVFRFSLSIHTHTLTLVALRLCSLYSIESKSTFASPTVCCSMLICDALKPSTTAKLSTSAHWSRHLKYFLDSIDVKVLKRLQNTTNDLQHRSPSSPPQIKCTK